MDKMPKAKTTHFTRRKSHQPSIPRVRDEDDANLTFEEFKSLTEIPMFASKPLAIFRVWDFVN